MAGKLIYRELLKQCLSSQKWPMINSMSELRKNELYRKANKWPAYTPHIKDVGEFFEAIFGWRLVYCLETRVCVPCFCPLFFRTFEEVKYFRQVQKL